MSDIPRFVSRAGMAPVDEDATYSIAVMNNPNPYYVMYDEHVRRLSTLTAEVERLRGALRECTKHEGAADVLVYNALRKALRECATHVGAALTDPASNELHCMVADEVGAVVSTLTAEVERLTQVCKEEGLHLKHPCRICGYNGQGFYQAETHKCMTQSNTLNGGSHE